MEGKQPSALYPHRTVTAATIDRSIQYQLPAWMPVAVTPRIYSSWIKRMARGLYKRDVQRGGNYTVQEAADALHKAVLSHDGRDPYTGQMLRWELILPGSGGHHYRKPIVDHRNSRPEADFVICTPGSNAAKGSLTEAEFLLQLSEE